MYINPNNSNRNMIVIETCISKYEWKDASGQYE